MTLDRITYKYQGYNFLFLLTFVMNMRIYHSNGERDYET